LESGREVFNLLNGALEQTGVLTSDSDEWGEFKS
jgi:hypothetical protein